MKFLNRKKSAQNNTIPPEVQDYYKAERRERTGVAWLLAIGTLIVTILLVMALFFGGRWIYQKLTNKGDTNTTTTQTQSGDASKTGDAANQSSSGSSTTPSSKPSNGSTSAPSNTGTSSLPSAPSSSSSSTGVVPPNAARTNIPNTGPGDTIAVFFAVSLLGYLGHRFILAKD